MIVANNNYTHPAATDSPSEPRIGQRVFLPLVRGAPITLTHERHPIQPATDQTISALNGRLTVELPAGAITGCEADCTLHVLSPDPNAQWIEAHLYISSRVGSLNRPIRLAVDYRSLPSAFLDEERLTLDDRPSFDWLPSPAPSDNATTLDQNSRRVRVDTSRKLVELETDQIPLTIRLNRNYVITDLAPASGGSFYALASPIIYRVTADGRMTRIANLEAFPEIAPHIFVTRFVSNPATDEIYLVEPSFAPQPNATVYALRGDHLRPIYTLPRNYRPTARGFNPTTNVLYVALEYVDPDPNMRHGCSHAQLLAIDVRNATALGEVRVGTPYEVGLHRMIDDLDVDSTGRLRALQRYDQQCHAFADQGRLLTARDTSPLAPLSDVYPGFWGVSYLAADNRGRTYISNYYADVISVVEGPDSRLVGTIRVPRPTAMVVVGEDLFVVSRPNLMSSGEVVQRSINQLDQSGFAATLLETTLHGRISELHVQAPRFATPPAHNVLYYNGKRFVMANERSFTGLETSVTFPIQVHQPDPDSYPTSYQELTRQTARVEVIINGQRVIDQRIAAPALPYRSLPVIVEGVEQRTITVSPHTWVKFRFKGVLKSQENLFSPIEALQENEALAFLPNQGEFNFEVWTDGSLSKRWTVIVRRVGYMSLNVKPEVGATLWAGEAMLEIPPNAFPSRTEGYTVTISARDNDFNLRDPVRARSSVYYFNIEPEVTRLNRDLRLRIPAEPLGDEAPVMVLYDWAAADPIFPVPSDLDPANPNYRLVTIPAGEYPSSAADAVPATVDAAVAPTATGSWWRRSLNRLGQTGLWHAIGLPNERVENEHFVVLYHTRDVNEAYALAVLDALTKSRETLTDVYGYPAPQSQVIVKIAPWATRITDSEAFVPGIGTLGNWYIFFNDKLDADQIQVTAAHEFFHLVQKEISLESRFLAPKWWMEGTAVWAEYAVFPTIKSYHERIQADAQFITQGMEAWNSSPYATAAFTIFLEKEYGQGTIRRVFESLGWFTGLEQALKQATGKDLDEVMARFAEVYFTQPTEPYSGWPTESARNRFFLEKAENDLSYGMPRLSARIVQMIAKDGPASFQQSSGSVARLLRSCSGLQVTLLNADYQRVGLRFVGVEDPERGEVLERLGNYTTRNPLYALIVMGEGGTCNVKLRIETPTINSISPSTIYRNQRATITIYGAGFGPRGSESARLRVIAGGNVYEPIPAGEDRVVFDLPPSPYPGYISIQVQHKSGPISNAAGLTIIDPPSN